MANDYVPFSQGSDTFEETYETFKSRLVISNSTGHLRFEPMPTDAWLAEYYNGGFSEEENSTYNVETQFQPLVVDVARGVRDFLREHGEIADDFTYHDHGFAFGVWSLASSSLGCGLRGTSPTRLGSTRAMCFAGGPSQPNHCVRLSQIFHTS